MARHRPWFSVSDATVRGAGPGRWRRRVGLAAAVAAGSVLVSLLAPLAPARASAPTRWLTTWAPSVAPAGTDDPLLTATFPGNQAIEQSVRMIARTTSPGGRLRIRLSNRFGNQPVRLGPVMIGGRAAGSALQPGSNRPVRFGGRTEVSIGTGGDAVSDPVTFPVAAGVELAVSIHVVGTASSLTWHRFANSLSYASSPGSGDTTGDVPGVSYHSVSVSWFWLAGIETESSSYRGTIVALGDSITDGWEVAPDQPETWPAVLAARLEHSSPVIRRAVVNAGIAGNQVRGPFNCGSCGQPAVDRLQHDALDLPGITDLIVFEGTNDLGGGASADDVIRGLATIARRAHERGVRVFAATITPRGHANLNWSGAMEAARQTVNRWIRTTQSFDGVFDFDAAIRAVLDPQQMAAGYDSGDSVHPNAAGLAALANSIDLARLA